MPAIGRVPDGNGVSQCSAYRARAADAEDEAAPALGHDYVEREFLLRGHARHFDGPATGPATIVGDGERYVTRCLARFPTDPTRFSGRVVVEPFNTSLGPDHDALWSRVGELLQHDGDAWVGVTHRQASATNLTAFDPQRYAELDIRANDLSWDILAGVAALLRADEGTGLIGSLHADHLYLGGYSQSGTDTATFAMAIHPVMLASGLRPFDGYFPAGHSASLASLAAGTARLPRFEFAQKTAVGVPIVEVETQTDVEGFRATLHSGREIAVTGAGYVRRDDSDRPEDRYRLWEVAGAPHTGGLPGCDGGGSTFPTSAFLRAGLAHLFRWAEEGVAPPNAPRIELVTPEPVSASITDANGNAVGGLRSPFVDVPLARYSAHSGPGALCALVGTEELLATEVLQRRHGDAESYLGEFDAALDASIAAGHLLELDRRRLLDGQRAKAHKAFDATQSRGPA